MVLAVNELVRIAKVERVLGIFAKPPAPTVPYAVDKDEIAELIDEYIDNVLTYPADPRPSTVDTRDVVKYVEEIKGRIDDASSEGSMKLLT